MTDFLRISLAAQYLSEKGLLPVEVREKNDARVIRQLSSQFYAYEIIKRTGAKAADFLCYG